MEGTHVKLLNRVVKGVKTFLKCNPPSSSTNSQRGTKGRESSQVISRRLVAFLGDWSPNNPFLEEYDYTLKRTFGHLWNGSGNGGGMISLGWGSWNIRLI